MPRVLSSLAFWTRFGSVGLDLRISGLPNMRLKLPGARVGRIALPRRPAFLSAAPPPCASWYRARSLSAIR